MNMRLLLDSLKGFGILKSGMVEEAMMKVDRADFSTVEPYSDTPQPIGHNATISAPHMHAYALELSSSLPTQGDTRILDVGSGSGYLSVAYCYLHPEARVIGIEHIPELVQLAESNTRKHHSHLLDSGRLNFVVGDGRHGYPVQAPYNVIHVGAACKERPEELLKQLKPGGKLIVPQGDFFQELLVYEKNEEGVVDQCRRIAAVRYVPLTGRKEQEGTSL